MRSAINPEYVKPFIKTTHHPSEARGNILFFLFLFVDLFMLIPLYADPFEPLYPKLVLIPAGLLHLFGFWIILSPYKRQIYIELFWGILGFFIMYGYSVVAVKAFYGMFGFRSPLFLIGLVIYIAAVYWYLFRWHFHNLKTGYYLKVKQNKPHDPGPILTYVTVIGALIFALDLVAYFMGGGMVLVFIVTLYLGLATVLQFFSMFFHRFILMIRHPDWVTLDSPQKKK